MKKMICKFISGEEGASFVEYGLLITLIAITAVIAVGLFGDAVAELFNGVDEHFGG